MKTEKIEFELKSLSPLKMDRWVEGKQPKNEKEYMEQAKEKVYKNSKGLFIPASAVEACMRNAIGDVCPNKKTKAYRQVIQSCLHVEPTELLIGNKVYDEIVKDVVTRGKGEKVTRVVTFRPLIKEWKIKGIINYLDVPELSGQTIKNCLEIAGYKYGLLSHRPKFGRFEIINWKELR
jgi:hypothetical protein